MTQPIQPFNPPTALPALPRRDIAGAVMAGIATLVAGWAGAAWTFNKIVLVTTGSGEGLSQFGAHFRCWIKSCVHLATGGLAWPEDVPAYWHYVAGQPDAGWLFGIAGGSLAVAATSAAVVAYRCAQLVDPHVHVDGRKRMQGKEAQREAELVSKEKAAVSGEELQIHESLTLARHQVMQSILLMAAQGGGKTQILWRIVNAAIAKNYKLVVFDLAKGDYTKSLPVCHRLFALGDQRSSVWAIWRDIKTLPDAESFARGLIPAGGDDPMWSNAARAVLVAIFMKLINERGAEWGWKELGEIAYLPLVELKEIAEKHYPPALSAVADAESKTSQSIIINLHAFLGPLYRFWLEWSNYDRPEKREFSWIDWLNDDAREDRVIVLQSNAKDKGAATALIRSMMEVQVSHIASLEFEESRSRSIGWLLDELPQLGRLECLSTILEIGRSKGCAILAMAFQDIAQVRQIYPQGEDDKWLAMLGIRVFGQVKGGASQRFVLDQVGMRTVERPTDSVTGNAGGGYSVSKSWQRAEIPVIPQTDLEKLGPHTKGVRALVLGHGGDALELDWPYFSPPDLRPVKVPRVIKKTKQDLAEASATVAVELKESQNSQESSTGAASGNFGIAETRAQLPPGLEFLPDLPTPAADELADSHNSAESSGGAASWNFENPENPIADALTEHVAGEVVGEILGVDPEIVATGLELIDAMAGSAGNGDSSAIRPTEKSKPLTPAQWKKAMKNREAVHE